MPSASQRAEVAVPPHEYLGHGAIGAVGQSHAYPIDRCLRRHHEETEDDGDEARGPGHRITSSVRSRADGMDDDSHDTGHDAGDEEEDGIEVALGLISLILLLPFG
jgi:hypothetical protein